MLQNTLNPYVKAIAKVLSIPIYVYRSDSLSRFNYKNLLIVPSEEGWKIFDLKMEYIPQLKKQFNLYEKDGFCLLQDSPVKDRIESILEFLNEF